MPRYNLYPFVGSVALAARAAESLLGLLEVLVPGRWVCQYLDRSAWGDQDLSVRGSFAVANSSIKLIGLFPTYA